MSRERDALAELVACKDLDDEITRLDDPMNWKDPPGLDAMKEDQARREPLAWAAARAALSADDGPAAEREELVARLLAIADGLDILMKPLPGTHPTGLVIREAATALQSQEPKP